MEKILNIKIEKNLYLLSWLILLILGFVLTYNLENIFSEKYFYDSLRILKMIEMNNFHIRSGDSYGLAAYIFSFMPLKSLQSYNICIYLVFIIWFIKIILKTPRTLGLYILNFIFIFLSIIYLLRPGKEILQLIILALCYIFRKYTPFFLIVGGIIFRHYLILQAGIYIGVWILVNKKNKKKWLVLFLIIFIFLNIIFPKLMFMIFSVRDFTNKYRIDSLDAKTIILNIFNGNSIIIYYINYLINFIRILFPIELFFKGLRYLPYIFFQIWFSIKLWNWRKMLKNEYTILLYSYIFVSVIFEPDFGSFLRHSVPYLIFIIALIRKEKKNEKNSFYNSNFR